MIAQGDTIGLLEGLAARIWFQVVSTGKKSAKRSIRL
jgi:hypothetical protein